MLKLPRTAFLIIVHPSFYELTQGTTEGNTLYTRLDTLLVCIENVTYKGHFESEILTQQIEGKIETIKKKGTYSIIQFPPIFKSAV